jgi:hypothetical protein
VTWFLSRSRRVLRTRIPTARRGALTLAAVACFLFAGSGGAEENKPDPIPGKPPRVALAVPLAVARGATTKVLLRGLHLAGATEVRVEGPAANGQGEPARATVKSSNKAAVAEPLSAEKLGDSQAEVELTLPVGSGDEVSVVVVSPDGATQPYPIRVYDPTALTAEKEPNGGFRSAQPLTAPATVAGAIGELNDVDVFRIEGKAGQKIIAEVTAARLNSPLDSILTLYDANGHVLATNDDSDAGADSLLRATLPADGVYFLGLTDANGRGGPLYGYLLNVRVE